MPNAGIRKKPASNAPAAAPTVFAAYNTPASLAACEARRTVQREAIGNVAPMAAAGATSRSVLETNRRVANIAPPFPFA